MTSERYNIKKMGDRLTPADCKGFNSTQKYRLMQCPFVKQPLHLLYEGRFLEPNFNYDGSNIPNEDMEGLDRTRKVSRSLRVAYQMEKEALERHLAGKDKIYPLPAVEPEAMIEDPRLAGTALEFGGASAGGNINNNNAINSAYDHLQEINALDKNLVNNVARKEEDLIQPHGEPLVDSNGTLPEYDWDSRYGKEYPFMREPEYTYYENPDDTYKTDDAKYVEAFQYDNKEIGGSKPPFSMLVVFLAFFILVVLILICVVGGIGGHS